MATMRQDEVIVFLKKLRDQIINDFESLEPSKKFERSDWKHKAGGGGEISMLRGAVFEKAAVNWSAVSGEKFPMNDAEGAFFATGISLITHMQNPLAPTVHMNIRYIETEKKSWFGGGYDLTPMGYSFDDDREHFHFQAKKALDPFGDHLYPEFSKNAADYFYIPHWKKERGIGGIFFDHYNTGNFAEDFEMWKHVGSTFTDAIIPIYKRQVNKPYTPEMRETQSKFRAHYVEFNLLYDRGTKFGFQSGGNPQAILCSMPPTASW